MMQDENSTPLGRGLHRLAAGLQAAFEASRAIQHNLSAGEAREHAVARELQPHFPAKYSLSSGIVVNAVGHQSRQQDIIVTDPTVGTPFVAEGNIGVHPIETVVASLQVKTSLDAGEVRDAVSNVASVKRLMPNTPRGVHRFAGSSLQLGETKDKPFAGVVAFQASTSHEALRRAYLKANADLPTDDRCNALFVLDNFVTLWSFDDDPLHISVQPMVAGTSQTIVAARDSILFFYVTLMKAINEYVPPPLDLSSYLNANMPTVRVFRDKIEHEPLSGSRV